MRINLVLPRVNLAGGIRVLAVCAQMLQARGHRVAVRSVGPPKTGLRGRVRAWRHGRKLHENGAQDRSHFDDTNVDHRVIAPPRPIADRDLPDADIVLATWWETAEWVARLSRCKGAKAHLIQHDESLFAGQPTKRVLETWRLPMPKLVVSRWLGQLARQRNAAAPVYHVPNGVETNTFNGPPRRKQSRPTLGVMYSQTPFKGTAVGFDAITRARQRLRQLRIVSFGMDLPTDDLPLPENCRFEHAPAQSRIAELYRSVDAWLVPSHSEGFGLPVLEAMACRTPVIATPVGAAPELLKHGGGWLLPRVDDATAMADAVEEAMQLPESNWQPIADHAHAIAMQHAWPKRIERLERALRAIARRHNLQRTARPHTPTPTPAPLGAR